MAVHMGAVIGVALGAALSSLGFLVMRNPMRLSFLFASSEGYYQRLVLDTTSRIQLRILGILVCLFGSGILTAALASILRADLLTAISDELWGLLSLVFLIAWTVGVVLAVIQGFKGKSFEWFQMWKTGAQLGPIDVFPLVTPKMHSEARSFTVIFLTLACLAAMAAVLR
jgi:hypothetical protein